jgi:hypothetical protein
MNHLMFLVGGAYRLLKTSISGKDRDDAACYFKLFCAQGYVLYGMYTIYQPIKACYTVFVQVGISQI